MIPVRMLLVAASFVAGQAAHADQLYAVRLRDGELLRLTHDATRGYGSPDWSPDGTRIAFDTWPLGGGFDTVRISLLGFDPSAEADDPIELGPGAMPSWSPDGTQLVCHTYNPNQIVVVNTDGSGREAILDQWGSPRWRPGGREVLTCRGRGLASFDLATAQQRVVLDDFSVRLGFGVSPDGRSVCVAADTGGVGVSSFDTGRDRFLTRQRLDVTHVAGHTSWSPDGERVATTLRRRPILALESGRRVPLEEPTGPGRLVVFDMDGNARPEEVTGVPADWDCSDCDWSPDGEWLVFKRKRGTER